MATKLVIVESPAKARTIGSYLGSDYEVEASIGHIRDLIPNAKGLPAELKKKWWADYGVDVDNNFEPFYEVPPEKAQQVKKLREKLKGKDTLVLATDEDREGEAISWHLLQVLKPGKGVDVKRIAFHEITPSAIREALENPRKVDECLVEAQETRRILDRLYGYTLSPVLWSRVTKNLSAGRVQSPAVKLIVEREMARRSFRESEYWDLKADFESDGKGFSGELKSVGADRVATGNDFDDATGQLKPTSKAIRLDEPHARRLGELANQARPYKVTRVQTNEAQEKPAPPFMTTTLQQDANRKFGFSADRTMRVAQTLYEGVDINGEPVGLITYMRTDSLTLSKEALGRIRDVISRDFPDCLPDKPQQYTSKVRNAQEAHEAIRPTDSNRRPEQIKRFLNEDQLRIYTLIWQRTLASQMKPARVLKTEADVSVETPDGRLTFLATGKQILFDGFLRIYALGRDEEADDPRERLLPTLKEGQEVDLKKVTPAGHRTKPPARFTDATLIKRLEDLGIGRPSTYASIIAVIVDRGYVRKAGKQLVPSFKAFLAHEVLEGNFHELTDLGFTARMDDELDRIAGGERDSKGYLKEFFLGEDGKKGLRPLVEERKREIPYPAFEVGPHPETGEPMVVRQGKDGRPFLQIGDESNKRYANVPEDLAPGDLTPEKAVELLAQKEAPAESIGIDPSTGRRLLVKFRQGYYLEVERTPEEIEAKEKPTWISLPPGVDPKTLGQEDLNQLASLPKEIGSDPESGQPVSFRMGKFGAYLEMGSERRTVDDWRAGISMSLEDALERLKQPKFGAKRGTPSALKEFGELEGAAGPVKLLAGRFGPYLTDGEVNATIPRGTDPASVTPEQAIQLLKAKREAGPSTRKFVRKKATTSKTKTATKTRAKK
ncbi:MAG TPA: type I DNA topoisomerase [Fimbriimonas sp.]|nr:type I DNA topoisomerase [Fimbriimonas sp.]